MFAPISIEVLRNLRKNLNICIFISILNFPTFNSTKRQEIKKKNLKPQKNYGNEIFF
jgi:hypothetical protein